MNDTELRDYCLAKHGVTNGSTFGVDLLFFRVMHMMLAPMGSLLKIVPRS